MMRDVRIMLAIICLKRDIVKQVERVWVLIVSLIAASESHIGLFSLKIQKQN